MPSGNRGNQWLIAIFLLGALLFDYPILSLFNSDVNVLGIPLLVAYFFAIWAVMIVLFMIVTRGPVKGSSRKSKERGR